MENVAKIVKERREELGMSQDELAKRAETSQATIDKIENGRSQRSKFLPAVFSILDIPLEKLVGGEVTMPGTLKGSQIAPVAKADLVTPEADLPIYTAVRAGSIDDSVLVNPDPIDYVKRPEPLAKVKNGYGLYIIGDSMVPAYRHGDLALIHPNIPARAGDEVVVCSQDVNGEHYAVIKLLTRATADKWHLKQYNPSDGEPAEFTLDRKEWPICHLVVGNYRKR